jgi:3-oxoadipate enol-lactonase
VSAAVAVHHLVAGPADAPAVVFSHSIGATLATWEAQAAALARAFRVVRYDLRGHGRSPVPPGPYDIADLGGDLIALLDRLGIARAHLVGLSLGAMASLWTAARFPARVERLVVCCTAARLGPPEMWAERAATVRAQGTGAIADAAVARWLTPGFRARHPERTAELRAMIAATPAEGYAGCCAVIEKMDLRPELGAIRAPTLAVAGVDDPATPPDRLREIADAIPDGRLVVVPAAAHLASVEQPERVSELILQHLEEEPRR